MARILFILDSFFPYNRAGTEVYVLNLSKYLKTQNWDVNVLIATSSHITDYNYEGIPIYTFDVPKHPISKELNGLIPPRGIDLFIKRVKEINPDLVHFHSFGRAINGYHLKEVKELGIKTAFTPHLGSFFCIKGDLRLNGTQNCDGYVTHQRCMACLFNTKGYRKSTSNILSYSVNQLVKLSFIHKRLPPALFQAHHRQSEIERVNQYADLIFSIAPWIQETFIINGIKNAQLIPQGINPLFINNLSKNCPRPEDSVINFAFIGRMHPIKGFHVLMEALSKINSARYRLHVITIKSEDDNEYYMNARQWADEKNQVSWNENLSPNEILSYYSTIDCLVLPSINEMAPLASLEALAQKKLIICSDIPAFRDQIKEYGGGILVEKNNPKALAFKLNEIIESDQLLFNLVNEIKRPYSMDQVSVLIEKSYNSILNP